MTNPFDDAELVEVDVKLTAQQQAAQERHHADLIEQLLRTLDLLDIATSCSPSWTEAHDAGDAIVRMLDDLKPDWRATETAEQAEARQRRCDEAAEAVKSEGLRQLIGAGLIRRAGPE